MADTAIEWTDKVWNPVRGCSLVSAGCTNCYAMKQAHRFSGPGGAYEGLTMMTSHGPVWTGKARPAPEAILRPLFWHKPALVFVNSMSDLFHEDVPFTFIDKVFAVMARAHQHTFQILTKRPKRMCDYLTAKSTRERVFISGHVLPLCALAGLPEWPLPNVWLGVSVENQEAADERIPLLLQTPAAVRWISAEPLLGEVNLEEVELPSEFNLSPTLPGLINALSPADDRRFYTAPARLDWVVAGGESGPGARPMHPEWARALRNQCKAAGVPFFFKQWGDWVSVSEVPGHGPHHQFPDGATVRRVGKKLAGRTLDGGEYSEYPA
jgi:protein gp37